MTTLTTEKVQLYLGNQTRATIKITHRGDGITLIDQIWVPARWRNRGYGSQALRQVCSLADGSGITLVTGTAPLDHEYRGLSQGQIEIWLIRSGFVPNRGVHVDRSISYPMYRRPRG